MTRNDDELISTGPDFSPREKANPTPIKKLEAFYKTWLYFSLLCEFAKVNSDSPGASPRELPLMIISTLFTTTGPSPLVILGVWLLALLQILWS